LFGGRAIGKHLNVREREVEVLVLRVFEVTLTLVPGSAFEVQTMDPYTFRRLRNSLALNLGVISDYCVAGVGDFSTLFNCVEGPVVDSVSTGDLLTHTGEEALWVEEPSEPVGDKAVS